MKVALSLLISALVTFPGLAQERSKRTHHIYLQGGIAAPLGELDLMGLRIEGMINDGGIAKISYAKDIFSFLAVGATIGRRVNSFNIAVMEEATSGTVLVPPWRTTTALADLYLKLPLKQFSIYTRGSVGLAMPKTWQLDIHTSVETGRLSTVRKPAEAYSAAGGISYRINKLEFGLETDLLLTNPELRLDFDGMQSQQKQLVGTWNNSLRLGYNF
ncbi:hypothetical protein [Pontibacter sp. SGAir0037]|uniref:hypothetical protein n=1 Tax=Pontibacter sp. SGAir0037 TaxID=2571030 RepID=UPI0010CD00E5|nr:hypothetical protein [Pontibacter sp. SGAir0037]QCR23182.1 hypothetical protein C1N53_13075 [Pontibacter sp. SGAir0037]